jgi:hypothetical protein
MTSLRIALVGALLLISCVQDRPYRLQGEAHGVYDRKFPGQQQPSETREINGRSYDISFVEFDDKGDFWDRSQLKIAAGKIKDAPKPVLLVVFIHGWHHNAADRPRPTKNPGDVETFNCLLSKLAASSTTRDLHVHGVYLGWRGRLMQGWPDYLTFLGRKATATRVAGTPVTETIFELIRQARRKGPNTSKAVVIGHSFGALVLEKAMAQAYAGSVLLQDAQSEGGAFNAPADLVLLVNSAAESIYAKELEDMFRAVGHRSHIRPEQPLFVSITAETDSGTKTWFPFGTFLPNLFARRHYDWVGRGPTSDNVSQNEYLTTTPGHNKRLFTHTIASIGPTPSRNATPPDLDACGREDRAFEQNLVNPKGMQFRTTNPARPDEFEWWRFKPVPEAPRSKEPRKPTPYWVVQVPPTIIDGHTPIFTPEGCAMMAALYTISNPEEGPRQLRLKAQ